MATIPEWPTIRHGIAAVRGRLENGTLRVLEGSCPNLVAEAGPYRYGAETDGRRSEAPVDEYNHALAALRYLISRLDARLMSRDRKCPAPLPVPGAHAPGQAPAAAVRPARKWLSIHNEELWTRLY
jgi:hypothetical protein